MHMYEKTESMRKYVFINNIFITFQIILVVLSVVFNFIIHDEAVVFTIFFHVGISVLYNIIVENIIEYGFLRKKYARICDEIPDSKYFKLKNRMYKTARNEKDIISKKLIIQSGIKIFITILSIASMLFMVPVE